MPQNTTRNHAKLRAKARSPTTLLAALILLGIGFYLVAHYSPPADPLAGFDRWSEPNSGFDRWSDPH